MVSEHDRQAMARQAAALASAECDDEGTLAWRHGVVEEANAWRQTHDLPPLATEGELHHRARALGLLARDPVDPG